MRWGFRWGFTALWLALLVAWVGSRWLYLTLVMTTRDIDISLSFDSGLMIVTETAKPNATSRSIHGPVRLEAYFHRRPAPQWRWWFDFFDNRQRGSASWSVRQIVIPDWCVVAPVGIPWVFLSVRRRWWFRKGRCPECGYSLDGLAPGVPCPECGTRRA